MLERPGGEHGTAVQQPERERSGLAVLPEEIRGSVAIIVARADDALYAHKYGLTQSSSE